MALTWWRFIVGRNAYPRVVTGWSERRTRAMESFLQTTRVLPGFDALKAEGSERAFGTLPPAAGLT